MLAYVIKVHRDDETVIYFSFYFVAKIISKEIHLWLSNDLIVFRSLICITMTMNLIYAEGIHLGECTWSLINYKVYGREPL